MKDDGVFTDGHGGWFSSTNTSTETKEIRSKNGNEGPFVPVDRGRHLRKDSRGVDVRDSFGFPDFIVNELSRHPSRRRLY